MRSLFATILRSALIGAALALPILGAGGRGIMRIIAHMEGRVPVLTLGGTVTVLFAGTMAGLAAGAVHGIMRRYIHNIVARNILFALISVAFTWRAVNELLPRPRLMFVALTLFYVLILEVVTARAERHRDSRLTDFQLNPLS
jgi:hypothetical protein